MYKEFKILSRNECCCNDGTVSKILLVRPQPAVCLMQFQQVNKISF